jgi:hypothetical protein
MRYDFIEVGTCNFDTEIQTCDDFVFGISIEPLQHYLDDLPNKPNVRKVCAALTSHDGYVDIYHIKPDVIKSNKLSPGTFGCNSINIPHESKKNLPNYEKMVSVDKVKAISWKTLISDYDITSIGYLKVDTEGHDGIIISHYLDVCEINPDLLADKVLFESNSLSNKELEKTNIDRFIAIGYSFEKVKNKWGEYDVLLKKGSLV